MRNKSGENYGKPTLLSLRSGIERYLNYPPHNRGIKFSKNPVFRKSNMILDAKIKNLKQLGQQNTKHKPAITTTDLKKPRVHPVISPTTPRGLLRNVWFHTTLYWCRRGREGQRNLTPSSFTFAVDENSRAYVTMTQDELSKNHPGGFDDTESYEKDGKLYRATDDLTDGYNALELYISKLNPQCSAFFQFPKRKWSPNDSVWYENRSLGVNKLAVMMRDISEEAQLSTIYTNHSVRATAITLWSDAGLENRHIMAISGHRNEQSFKSYNSRPSTTQLRQSSDILSRSLLSSNANFQVGLNYPQPAALFSHVTSSSQSTSMYHRSNFDNMFSSCSIGTVNVTVNPPRDVVDK